MPKTHEPTTLYLWTENQSDSVYPAKEGRAVSALFRHSINEESVRISRDDPFGDQSCGAIHHAERRALTEKDLKDFEEHRVGEKGIITNYGSNHAGRLPQVGESAHIFYATKHSSKDGALYASLYPPQGYTQAYSAMADYVKQAEICKIDGKVVSKDQAKFLLAASALRDGVDISRIQGLENIGQAIKSSQLFKDAVTAAYDNQSISKAEANLLGSVSRDGKIDQNDIVQLNQFLEVKKQEKTNQR